MSMTDPRLANLPEPLVSVTDISSSFRIEPSADNDVFIHRAILASEDVIKDYCSSNFEISSGDAETRLFQAPLRDLPLLVDDMNDNSAEVLAANGVGDAWSVSTGEIVISESKGRQQLPRLIRLSPAQKRIGWLDRCDENGFVSVSAHWGWTELPYGVRQALIIMAGRLFFRTDSKESSLGMMAASSDADMSRYIRSVDPDIQSLLAPFAGRRRSRIG